ncbi:MAG: ubiquinone/menaquinone biosynthesis methyltransferase, partial [Candidatus Dormibacteraeota bacterium]|nr:ubiquinone/menaquinone biosynthesis methyltransferase [Candidatus Dormibacteraeota bacterium]
AARKAETVEAMFNRIAARYDALNRLFTFGLDAGWRRRTVSELRLPRGSRVVDLACGTGDLCDELARTGLRPLGVDFAAGMLARAHTSAPLLRGDITRLPLRTASFDGATCGFALRNVTDIRACFAETARVLRPGGRAAFLEVASPRNALLRAAHGLYFNRVVPWVGARLSDGVAYRYLPASAAYLPEPRELCRLLEKCGFSDVRRIALGGGAAQLLTGTRAA